MDVDDFHKRLKEIYSPPKNQFTLIEVPEIRFAVIDGKGDPQSDELKNAIKWLYSLVHLVKPLVKKRMGKRFIGPPVEFLFWADNGQNLLSCDKEKWSWRVMVVFVDWITQEVFADAVLKAQNKLGPAPETLRLENLHEGKSVQFLHIGDYAEIESICNKLYGEYLPDNNLHPHGCYHEIYLNDPARAAPNKRKTLIRQPVILN